VAQDKNICRIIQAITAVQHCRSCFWVTDIGYIANVLEILLSLPSRPSDYPVGPADAYSTDPEVGGIFRRLRENWLDKMFTKFRGVGQSKIFIRSRGGWNKLRFSQYLQEMEKATIL